MYKRYLQASDAIRQGDIKERWRKDAKRAKIDLNADAPSDEAVAFVMRRQHPELYTDSTTTIPFGLPPIAGHDFNTIKGRTSLSDAARNANRIDKAREWDKAYLNNC